LRRKLLILRKKNHPQPEGVPSPVGRTLKLKQEFHLRAQAAKTKELQPLPVRALKRMTLVETEVP
jgi:hypothetical protein